MKTGNREEKLIAMLACILLVVFMAGVSTFGDVGNGASHQKSGSVGRSRSGTSYGGYGGGGGARFFFFGGPAGFGGGDVVGIIIVIGVAYIIYRNRSRLKFRGRGDLGGVIGDLFGGNSGDDRNERDIPRHYNPEGALMAIKQSDPNFSKTVFESKVSNMYIQLQEAWMGKNWRIARVFETDELFNVHAKQLQRYVDTNTTNKVENIAVLKCELVKYEDDGVNDVAHVLIKARINDYTVDDNSGKIVSGDPKVDIYMTYIWKLVRRKGIVTKLDGKAAQASQCPNCGANVSINASGECEYCGSLVTSGQYDWVLASIEVVDQQNDC